MLPGSEEFLLNTFEEPSRGGRGPSQLLSSTGRMVMTAKAMARLPYRTALPKAWKGACVEVPQPLGAGVGLKQGQEDLAG